MRLSRPTAQVYVPDGASPAEALARTTHLAVAAHADDVELMALDGIFACFGQADRHFAAIVVTDGAGSPRSGPYAAYSDAEMRAVRRREQLKAAQVGEYGAMLLLDHPSRAVREGDGRIVDDLVGTLEATRPEIVYTHNPADRHDTHVAVALRTIAALRCLPADARPMRVLGCEVWRDLDWLTPADRVELDVGGRDSLAAALIGVHDSQIAGGKRYDLAALGRRRANATFGESHTVDSSEGLTLALDLTPLIRDDALDVAEFVGGAVARLAADVARRIREQG